jgi:hypothetical protein
VDIAISAPYLVTDATECIVGIDTDLVQANTWPRISLFCTTRSSILFYILRGVAVRNTARIPKQVVCRISTQKNPSCAVSAKNRVNLQNFK